MQILKWLRIALILLISCIALVFGIQNHQAVSLQFVIWQSPALGVQVWLGLAFLAGILSSLLLVRRK
ncbi:hypothetical protein [Salinibius halmophilus]|uniref:hypothetical protein n=1 Tax=Salinibius halmophilus TaxID=1853216 RepID=UPI000E6728F9|nr:hypothetical protein [Salinibius halmophilus]